MKFTQLQRVFVYNGVTLPDPGGSLGPEAVKDLYSATYPELVSAAVDGPVMKAGKQTFTFIKAVRDKGAKGHGKWLGELMDSFTGEDRRSEPGVRIDVGNLADGELKCGTHVDQLFKRQSQGMTQACMVAEALPLLL